MSEYQSFHCTALGYSHVKKATVCQDCSGSFDGDGFHIAVVSDGHGHNTSFRSDVGSRVAVDVAMEQLQSLAEFLKGREEMLFRKEEKNSLLQKLADRVVSAWNTRIRQHLLENPITEEEYALAGNVADLFRAGRDLPRIYGATLIAALVTDRYLLVMQQGDGRCVVLHENGKADQPVPWDERCVGNVCTSLCLPDAAASCRFYVEDQQKDQIVACYVTTDGVEDCFPDLNGLNSYFSDITGRFSGEMWNMVPFLKDQLPIMSRNGSADDMSVAAVVDARAATLLADRLKMVSLFYSYYMELRKAREKMHSMERKMEYLKNQYRKAVDIWNHCRKQAGTGEPEDTMKLHQAEQAVSDARWEYNSYVDRFNSFRAQAMHARKSALGILDVMTMLGCGYLLENTDLDYIRQKIQKKKVYALERVILSGQGEET